MEHERIRFPESYTNTLSPEEVEELATAIGVKFDLHGDYYDSAFDKISSIVCRIVRDNIGKVQITKEMQWKTVEDVSEMADNEDFFRQDLFQMSEDRKAEALCSLSLAKKGTLKREIAEKVGKIIRDLIKENHIHYAEAA